MTPEFIVAWAAPVIGVATIALSGWAGRHTGRAAIKQATTDERKAATADWAAYTAELREHNGKLMDRLGDVEKRLDHAEIRADAADIRATKAETLYALAITYLRRVAAWVNEHWPDETLPPPPPELEPHL